MPPYRMGGYYMPPAQLINQNILTNDAMRTLVYALGRGASNLLKQHVNRDHNSARNRSITISKLLTTFLGEGDHVSHVE